MDKMTFIRRSLSKSELLLQLAEEANELVIAAMEFKNTPSSDNHNNFIEEIADVKLCIDILYSYYSIQNNNLEFYGYNKIYTNLIIQSCKVSKSALKLRRTIEPEASPTPVTEKEAEDIFIKAINKLLIYINITGYLDTVQVKNIYEEKLDRWFNRLNIKG